jgi:predicted nucleotidyltransferase
MDLKELKQSGRIIFECTSGSHAYGTSTPKSDIDIRGFYVNPAREYLGLSEPAAQIGDEKQDITYYSLKRAFELLTSANPNMIELLWMPEDCVKITSTTMEKLIANRDIFISKKCFHTHSGYAYAQIKKAKGQNKKVHNPQSEEMPVKEDFCWIIPVGEAIDITRFEKEAIDVFATSPCRPIPLKQFNTSLREFHCAGLEHTTGVYRLYFYGEEAKGVFRGNDMLVTESIPLKDEFENFYGFLIYNQVSYEKAVKDWHSYHDWKKNRNEARWVDQEKGNLNYDQKNMMHCFRLLMSGENILTQGYPLVRFTGAQQEYLMAIRKGDFKYEDLIREVEERMARLEKQYETSTIPHKVNQKEIEKLYRELTK